MAVAQYTLQPPALTSSAITALPWHRTFVMTDKAFSVTWEPSDDPDQFYFAQTTAAVDVGGIAYAAASTALSTEDVIVCIAECQAVIQVRNRRI